MTHVKLHPLRKRLRDLVRMNRRVYAFWRVIKYGPFMGFRAQTARRDLLRQGHENDWLTLYLGSGGRRQDRMINLDITDETGPDVVGDGYHLPFADSRFDAIFCEYVIEHVGDPEAFIKAASRVLKPNGLWYFEVPFMQPIHAEGVDFTRWTKRGFAQALERCGLQVIRSGVHTGAAYATFWMIKETLALGLTGGVKPFYPMFRYALAWLLSPLLLGDLLMLRLEGAEQVASGYYFVAATPASSQASLESAATETIEAALA